MLLFTVVLFIIRWPVICFRFELNPDETMMAAQAITLLQSGWFYSDIDGTTGGPLLSVVLMAPAFLGLPIDFFSGRVIGSVIFLSGIAATVVAFLLLIGDARRALTAIVGTAGVFTLFYALSNTTDFGSYHSELLPAAFLAWAESLLLLTLANRGRAGLSRVAAFVIGLLCGIVPFAKLQATPIGLVIAFCCYVVVFLEPRTSLTRKLQQALAVTGGGLFPAAAAGLVMSVTQSWESFALTGVANNLRYAAEGSDLVKGFFAIAQRDFDDREPVVEALVLIMTGISFLNVMLPESGARCSARRLSACALFVLLSAFLSIVLPGRGFPHYWMLGVFPACFAGGIALVRLVDEFPRSTIVGASICLVVLVSLGVGTRPLALQIARQQSQMGPPEKAVPGLKLLRTLQRPGDRLICWGWQSSYHIYTQMPLGWPGANYVFLDDEASLRPEWRQYVAYDLGPTSETKRRAFEAFHRNQPRFVLDVTGPLSTIFRDRGIFGIEACAEFEAMIRADYELVIDSDVVRIYLRSEGEPSQ